MYSKSIFTFEEKKPGLLFLGVPGNPIGVCPHIGHLVVEHGTSGIP